MLNTTYKNWHTQIDDNHILWLSLDRQNSDINTINAEVLAELDHLLDEVIQQPAIIGVIIQSAKSSGFIAGADIEQFAALQDQTEAFNLVRKAQLIFDKLADLSIPTVAMIKGFCLGGGLELALACRYRVAEEGVKTILGAPEVNLGLCPGWGGTVRLPKLIGVLPAMQMNLTGRSINAKAAAKLALIDVGVPERHLVQAARYYILNKPAVHQPAVWQKWLNEKLVRPWVGRLLYKNLEKKISRTHYPAPYAIVDNWVKESIYSEEAMMLEAQSIAALMMGSTSRNLVRDFFLQTRLKNLAKTMRVENDAKSTPKPVTRVHVIGAGMMGGDIAAWCVLKGLTVTLQDRSPDFISPAIQRAADLFQKKLKSPRLVQAALDRLIPDVAGLGIATADIVIEAVSEDLLLKQSIYQSIEAHLKPTAILATNTSSLVLDKLSSVLKNPARLVGIHFFNPVAMMQLVEVVHAPHTDADMLRNAIAFVRRIDRLPLPVQSCPGFLVNRVLMPYLMEAMILLDEGKSAEAIDKAAVDFGMPMGPIELADTIGLDVCLAVAEILAPEAISEKLKQKIAAKDLGKKTGRGFYAYRNGKAVKSENTSESAILTDRLILPMVNEAVACLREKIVSDDDLIDAGIIFGTGFAPFRGGPLHYAQTEGIENILERLRVLQHQFGNRFKPDVGFGLLEKHSENHS